MDIKTQISKHGIVWSWRKKLQYTNSNSFSVGYAVDISNTPKHLANYMGGLFLSEIISWNARDIVFDELTQTELDSLNDFVRVQHHENHFGRVTSKRCPVVKAKAIVEPYKFKSSGPILCANGMGKDGMLLAMMVKELGYDQLCFTVGGSYTPERFARHKRSTNKFYKEQSIKKVQWIDTSFIDFAKPLKSVTRLIAAVPLAVYFGSNVILQAFNIGESTVNKKTEISVRPLTGIFYANNINKALNIIVDGVQNGVSLLGSQKILIERYPEAMKYQRSCMRADHWCGKCGKCLGTPLLAKAGGNNPTSYGMPDTKAKGLSIGYWKRRGNVMEATGYIECINKLNSQPYGKWIDGINENALALSWENAKFGKIFRDHLVSYKEDPGDDLFGGIVDPSQWRRRMTTDYNRIWMR